MVWWEDGRTEGRLERLPRAQEHHYLEKKVKLLLGHCFWGHLRVLSAARSECCLSWIWYRWLLRIFDPRISCLPRFFLLETRENHFTNFSIPRSGAESLFLSP